MSDRKPIHYPCPTPPAPGEVQELAEGVFWIRLPMPMVLDHVNVYALADDDGWTLVDTGMDTPRTRALWQDLLAGPLAGRPVARVLVTHHHPDHIGLAGWFVSDHGAELITTRTAWLFARMLRLDVQEVPPPETLAFWRRAGMDAQILAERAQERPMNYADGMAWLPLGFRQIGEGAVLRLAGRDWEVRLGGGHAPDHATLWCRDAPLVIAGDQILPSISSNIGVYATEPEADPLADWIAACHRLKVAAAPDQLVLPGHQLPFTGVAARLAQLIAGHETALDRLRAHLAEPHTAAGCFPALYKRPIGKAEYGLALVEAIAHINHLKTRGEVRGRLREDGAMLWQIRG